MNLSCTAGKPVVSQWYLKTLWGIGSTEAQKHRSDTSDMRLMTADSNAEIVMIDHRVVSDDYPRRILYIFCWRTDRIDRSGLHYPGSGSSGICLSNVLVRNGSGKIKLSRRPAWSRMSIREIRARVGWWTCAIK